MIGVFDIVGVVVAVDVDGLQFGELLPFKWHVSSARMRIKASHDSLTRSLLNVPRHLSRASVTACNRF